MTTLRTLTTVTLGLTLTLAAPSAFAGGWGRGGFRGGFRGPAVSVRVGGGYRGGGMLRSLPRGYATYRYGGRAWFYGGGRWYRPWRGGFAAWYPPIGLCIPLLPLGYATYYYGGVPYYWADDVYYTSAPTGGYQVVDPPPEAPRERERDRDRDRDRDAPRAQAPPPAAAPQSASLDAVLIIPKDGQDANRMAADRQKAQRYALERSGYDPAHADPGDPGTPRARQAYLRALKIYLEERGYSVE